MSINQLFSDYPLAANSSLIFLFSLISLGINWFIDNRKQNQLYKREVKRIYWQEKITSAKKAVEYNQETVSILERACVLFKTALKANDSDVGEIARIQQSLVEKNDKMQSAIQAERHHFLLFFDLNTKKTEKLSAEINDLIRTQSLLPKPISNEQRHDYLTKMLKSHEEVLKELESLQLFLNKEIKSYVDGL